MLVELDFFLNECQPFMLTQQGLGREGRGRHSVGKAVGEFQEEGHGILIWNNRKRVSCLSI